MLENNKTALLIFSKTPVKGQVKTRLIPSLGEEQSTRLYEELFHHTIKAAMASNVDEIHICCSPTYEADCFQQYRQYGNIHFCQQVEGNLGLRMHHAIKTALMSFDKCIVIGCDCPDLDGPIINQARDWLDDVDVVLGPAEDGGYYLLATKQADLSLFKDIEWSTNSVLKKTEQNLVNMKLSWKLLPQLSDVDEAKDLKQLRKHQLGLYLPVEVIS